MNPRELVDHIRSGPAKLVLNMPLRFRRRTRSNPCDFNVFLQALQSSETIRDVECESHRKLNISEDEWVLLLKALGNIKDIQRLQFNSPGSPNFHPFQAVANAVNNAQSLCKLLVCLGFESLPIDPSGLAALANALREHMTLKAFTWVNPRSRTDPDLVLRALPACPHLREVTIVTKDASADAINNLLRLQPVTELHLVLEMDQWLAVADEIRQGRCKIKYLGLHMHQGSISDATEAVKVVADAIRFDSSLEHLTFVMKGVTGEAAVALAEALMVNTTLRKVTVSDNTFGAQAYEAFSSMHQAYEAFSSMLRVNTSLVLELPPFESAGVDERLRKSRQQMVIEQRLNRVGRGRLLTSSQTTKEEWVDALHEMSSYDTDDDPDALRISCIFSLFRLNPEVVSMS
jgi:hypothetical protein